AEVWLKTCGMGPRSRVATKPADTWVPSHPGPTIGANERPGGGRDGEESTRARALADRGGGRLVRVPRGDAGPVGDALFGGRAVGVGTSPPAAPGDQDS